MLIGISGAQGAGKTTLLNELKRFYKVDDFKVSRHVQKELGWESLDRVRDSLEGMIEFQREIIKQKYEHDKKLSESADIILVERTFADIAAYIILWGDKFSLGSWADKHIMTNEQVSLTPHMMDIGVMLCDCLEMQNLYKSTITIPLMDHVIFEEDANRASKEDAEHVYTNVKSFLSKYPHYEIAKQSIDDRVLEVQQYIESLK